MPRKPKAKAPPESQSALSAPNIIVEYLEDQNRPYSATDISTNLHGKVTKAQATKILQKLHLNEEIVGRTAGKQTVYHTLQNPDSETNPESQSNLRNLSYEIEITRDKLAVLRSEERRDKAALVALEAKPTVSELRNAIEKLSKEKEDIERCLSLANSVGLDEAGTGTGAGEEEVELSAEERSDLENEWNKARKQMEVRKKICRELWGICTEVLPGNMTREEIWESLGVEGTMPIQ